MSDLRLQLIQRAECLRLGVAGPGAEAWLAGLGVSVPEQIYGTCSFGDGGRAIRQGANNFFFECGSADEAGNRLYVAIGAAPVGVYAMERHDASVSVSGLKAAVLGVLAQTCAVDFRTTPPDKVVYTRIAGVNACLLPTADELQADFVIWFDPSYNHYLTHELQQIVTDVASAASAASTADDSSSRQPAAMSCVSA